MAQVFGIDLGTTNSLIAMMNGEHPRVLGDARSGEVLLPSVVALRTDGSVAVGRQAIELEPHLNVEVDGRIHAAGMGTAEEGVVIRSVKRFMGLGGDELSSEDRHRYAFADITGPIVKFSVGSKSYAPPQVSAEILRALKRWGEAAAGEPVEKVVITVPAYFNDGQRQATKDAGRLAGLEVVRLVNEPTAASLAYGLHKMAAGNVAVYDLGGGTFDVSILSLKEGIFEVLATNGDTHLGGDDLDRMLVNHLLAGLPDQLRYQRHVWNSARFEAESAKRRLSQSDETEMILRLPGETVRRNITRREFEAMASDMVERTLERCRMALKDASLGAGQIDAVVLVGGSTRVPLVRQKVGELFGREPLCSLDPDQVVALGAAVQAGVLTGQRSDLLLLDVVPLSLGIETMGGVMERIIHRNTTIPTSVKELFTTAVDNQTHVDIHVLQGERELANDCRSLARFKLGPLPPQPAGLPKVEVTFLIDANGILTVTARDERTGKEHSIDVKPSYGLTDQEIERMLEEAIDLGEEDINRRLLISARNDGEQILAALARQMREYGRLLAPGEGEALEAKKSELTTALAGEDQGLISRLVDELNELSTPFAQRIMEGAIRVALEKKSVEEVS